MNYDDIAAKLEDLYPDLARDIARCAEKAYRRGYQQGALHAAGINSAVFDWRCDYGSYVPNYDRALPPPVATIPQSWKKAKGLKHAPTSVYRLAIESESHCPVASQLAQNYIYRKGIET